MQPQEQPPSADALATVARPARALVGWVPEQEAALWLASRRADLQQQPQYVERARQAREAALSLNRVLDQSVALAPPPQELAAHWNAWSQHPAGAPLVAEGWQLAIADLTRICAIQPLVYTDYPTERIASLTQDDMAALAAVTLPILSPANLAAHFDDAQHAWIFSSSNPNLRIMGQFNAQLQPGVMGFGFAVGLSPSFIQIASFQGRLILRDGYHRAFALLAAGLNRVPVIHRTFNTSTELALPQGFFPFDVFLGPNPPLLTDYHDDRVSAAIQMPVVQKVLVIQALSFQAAT